MKYCTRNANSTSEDFSMADTLRLIRELKAKQDKALEDATRNFVFYCHPDNKQQLSAALAKNKLTDAEVHCMEWIQAVDEDGEPVFYRVDKEKLAAFL